MSAPDKDTTVEQHSFDKLLRKCSPKTVERIRNKTTKDAIISLTQFEDKSSSTLFKKRTIKLHAASVTHFDINDVFNIIRQKMPVTPDCIIKVCDTTITTYLAETLMKFMEFANVDTMSYKEEQFDCDDFSMCFAALARKFQARIRAQLENAKERQVLLCDKKFPGIGGSPIGMCQGKLSGNSEQHAFNFWISPDGDIYYIEPQTREFITELGQGATIDFVYI